MIHGLKEQGSSVWETREKTEITVREFFHNALNIKNNEKIKFADIHRMPKQPVLKNGKKIQRPIVNKLTNLFDKQLIYNSLENLKLYNNELYLKPRLPGYIYVTIIYPLKCYNKKRNFFHYSITPDKKAKENHGKS